MEKGKKKANQTTKTEINKAKPGELTFLVKLLELLETKVWAEFTYNKKKRASKEI